MSNADSSRFAGRSDHLSRLDPRFYQGFAYVHWMITMHDRKTGWLDPLFYYQFREILTHTLFRYGICCPIYCCMPDHIHLIWIGVLDHSDQLIAMKFFRKKLDRILEKIDTATQREIYDHVLREEERQNSAFEIVAEYIARNPERAGLIKHDCFRSYPYTECLVPGYPELELWKPDSWQRFWRCYSYLRKYGLIRWNTGES
jgi:putative transposase